MITSQRIGAVVCMIFSFELKHKCHALLSSTNDIPNTHRNTRTNRGILHRPSTPLVTARQCFIVFACLLFCKKIIIILHKKKKLYAEECDEGGTKTEKTSYDVQYK